MLSCSDKSNYLLKDEIFKKMYDPNSAKALWKIQDRNTLTKIFDIARYAKEVRLNNQHHFVAKF